MQTTTSTYRFFRFRPNQPVTIEEIKRQYHALALRWHPDRPGGDLATMQAINAEFDVLRKRYRHNHEAANGDVYEDKQEKEDSVLDHFEEIIDQLLRMGDIVIEVCGSFLWLGGNTYEHRAEIKAMGARWASKKKRWYFAPSDWQKRDIREWSMDQIRARHGSSFIYPKGHKRAAALAS